LEFEFYDLQMDFNILDLIFPVSHKKIDLNEVASFGKKPIIECVDAIWCGFDYKNEYVLDTIHRIKNGGEYSLAKDLTEKLYSQITNFYKKVKNQNTLESVDLRLMFESIFDNGTRTIISFVPSDENRVLRRGFHLPQIIAEEIFEIFGDQAKEACSNKKMDFLPTTIKTIATEAQSDLDREGRLSNNKGSFEVINQVQIGEYDSIILIDDICTTTATICECAKTIKEIFPKITIYGLAVASN
jgi:predicted amidophosphoribosyltransferase